MRTRAIVLVLFAAALLATRQLGAQTDFNWHGQLAAGQALEIKNVNGRIRAVPATSNDATVTARKTARRSNPADVRIEVVPHAGGVTICAVYPDVEGQVPNRCEPGPSGHMSTRHNDTVVDFEVEVPAGAKFIARTVNGRIDAEALAADVEAYSVNGSVRVATTGVAIGTTVNGSLNVAMGRARWPEGVKFSTVNGTVTLQLPAALDAHLNASTVNGSISSDFPITVVGDISRRRLDGTIGRGGQQLTVSTVNGSIHLRKAE